MGDASDPLAWNAYAYARCNPTSYIDPTGRSVESVAAAVVATIAIIILIIVVSVCTFGYGAAAAVPVGAVGVGTWGGGVHGDHGRRHGRRRGRRDRGRAGRR